MILSDLLQNINIIRTTGETEIDINDIQFDSRKISENSVFVATRGTAADGHEYIPMAVEKGAKAVVCETLPAEINDSVVYIQVDDSAEALGQMASAFFGYPSEKTHIGRSYRYQRKNHNCHFTL